MNRARRKRQRERNFGERGEAVRALGCLVPGPECWAKIDAAHARAIGMGGCKGDRRDLVNLCRVHHIEAGEFRTSQRAAFEEKYGVDLTEEAAQLANRFDEQGLP